MPGLGPSDAQGFRPWLDTQSKHGSRCRCFLPQQLLQRSSSRPERIQNEYATQQKVVKKNAYLYAPTDESKKGAHGGRFGSTREEKPRIRRENPCRSGARNGCEASFDLPR